MTRATGESREWQKHRERKQNVHRLLESPLSPGGHGHRPRPGSRPPLTSFPSACESATHANIHRVCLQGRPPWLGRCPLAVPLPPRGGLAISLLPLPPRLHSSTICHHWHIAPGPPPGWGLCRPPTSVVIAVAVRLMAVPGPPSPEPSLVHYQPRALVITLQPKSESNVGPETARALQFTVAKNRGGGTALSCQLERKGEAAGKERGRDHSLKLRLSFSLPAPWAPRERTGPSHKKGGSVRA